MRRNLTLNVNPKLQSLTDPPVRQTEQEQVEIGSPEGFKPKKDLQIRRHQVVYKDIVNHEECQRLDEDDLSRLEDRRASMLDFCRKCVFLTLFDPEPLVDRWRPCVWKLLLGFCSASTKASKEKFDALVRKEDNLLENTLRADGVMFENKKACGKRYIDTRFSLKFSDDSSP